MTYYHNKSGRRIDRKTIPEWTVLYRTKNGSNEVEVTTLVRPTKQRKFRVNGKSGERIFHAVKVTKRRKDVLIVARKKKADVEEDDVLTDDEIAELEELDDLDEELDDDEVEEDEGVEEEEDDDEDEDEDDEEEDEDDESDDLTEEDIQSMSKADLKELNEQEELGVKFTKGKKIADLRDEITDAYFDEEEEEDDEDEEEPEVEDDEIEDEEEEEEEAPKKKRSSKTKSSTKKGKRKPPVRETPADRGRVGTSEVADAAGVDGRSLRMLLRKLGIEKDPDTNRYEWSSLKHPEVRKILKAAKEGGVEKAKSESLDKLKSKKTGTKKSRTKAGAKGKTTTGTKKRRRRS